MARYSIDEKILTDLADGIRAAVGKEDGVPALGEAIYEVEGEGNSTDFTTEQNVFMLTVLTPEAKKVLVKDISITSDECDELYFKVGYCGDKTYSSISPSIEYRVGSEYIPNEIMLNATDMYLRIGASSRNIKTKIKISATVIALDADGNVLVNKEVVVPYDLTPEEMVEEINGLGDLPLVPDDAFYYTGDGNYKFAFGSLDWLVRDYGHLITTEDFTSASQMFYESKVEYIPFELNFKKGSSITMGSIFHKAHNLKEIPKINNCRPSGQQDMFSECQNLRYLPEGFEDWFDWSSVDNATSQYGGGTRGTNIFKGCFSLRSIPMGFLNHINPYVTSAYNIIFYGLFNNCYSLDEIVGLPLPRADKMNFTSNMFQNTFNGCCRLKDMTFATNEDGSPIVVKWKSQVIDLSSIVGYSNYTSWILNFNSGITADKEVKDDATYQALKNDPDWFTTKIEYSRYNHDSAVATINSLPDTSAYGTNNIKFKGASGSATDGGAINTLTAEEIAVATARGWTVSLV